MLYFRGENTKFKPTLGRGGLGKHTLWLKEAGGFVGLTFLLLVDDVLTEQIVVTQNDWGTQFRKVLLKPDHLVSKTRAAGHLIVQPGNRHVHAFRKHKHAFVFQRDSNKAQTCLTQKDKHLKNPFL